MDTSDFNHSPSRTYIIPVMVRDGVSFRKFTLPKNLDNDCSTATWYFYQIDSFSCGWSAYPIEMHNDVQDVRQGYFAELNAQRDGAV